MGHQREELVLLPLQVLGRGLVLHHALEAHEAALGVTGEAAHVELTAHAVGAHDGERQCVRRFRRGLAGQQLEGSVLVHGGEHVGQEGALQLLGAAAQDDGQSGVGVLDATVQVDLPHPAGRVAQDVLVAGPAVLLLADHRIPVPEGEGVGETVHGREHPGEKQRQGQTPVPAPLLGQLHRGLHDEVPGDAQDHQQLGQGGVGPRRGGSHRLQVLHQGLVHLGPLAGHGQDGLEAPLGLLYEAGLLSQAPPRGLGEDGGEDLEGPPRHLLGPDVQRPQQLLGVGVLHAELGQALAQIARAAVGVAGQERLQVPVAELGPVGAHPARREERRAGQRLDRLDRDAEVFSRLGGADQGTIPGVSLGHCALLIRRVELAPLPAPRLPGAARQPGVRPYVPLRSAVSLVSVLFAGLGVQDAPRSSRLSETARPSAASFRRWAHTE